MSKQHPFWPAIALMIVLALGLAACGPASTPEPEPTPTRPMRPTFTPSAVPTDTPVPTNTPVPTDTPVPVPTDTPTPAAPKAVIGGDGQVNVRSGPGTAYPETGQVATGSELELVSKNAAGDWYEICCVNGQPAWIVARLVEVTGDPNLIQVATNIPAPPAPTLRADSSGSAAANATPRAPGSTDPAPRAHPAPCACCPICKAHQRAPIQYEPDRQRLRWAVQQEPRPECSADWLSVESTTSWRRAASRALWPNVLARRSGPGF